MPWKDLSAKSLTPPPHTCLLFTSSLAPCTTAAEYVRARVEALRKQQPGKYWNAGCIRTNAMKNLPNYFEKGQLEKMFFLFAVRGCFLGGVFGDDSVRLCGYSVGDLLVRSDA